MFWKGGNWNYWLCQRIKEDCVLYWTSISRTHFLLSCFFFIYFSIFYFHFLLSCASFSESTSVPFIHPFFISFCHLTNQTSSFSSYIFISCFLSTATAFFINKGIYLFVFHSFHPVQLTVFSSLVLWFTLGKDSSSSSYIHSFTSSCLRIFLSANHQHFIS